MRIAVFASAPHQMEWADAFIEGLHQHGMSALRARRSGNERCDLAVFWSHRHRDQIREQRQRGAHYLVMELGYFRDRRGYCSLGYDGLNGRADFCNRDVPGDRWAQHGVDIAPWKSGGDYVLVMGQVEGDASIAHVNIDAWYRDTIAELRELTELPIRFRRHPLGGWPRGIPKPDGAERLLEEDLAGAAWVVTFNSNSGVDAALAGVPVVACDPGSMAWDVAGHLPGEVVRPDRQRWLERLAYCQWTMDEIRSGLAWAHLKSKFQ